MSELRPTFADIVLEARQRIDELNARDAYAVEYLLVERLLVEIAALRREFEGFGGLAGCWKCNHPIAIHKRVHPSEYPMRIEPARCGADMASGCDCKLVGGWA